MARWSDLSDDEIKRRRALSIAASEVLSRQRFEAEYQAHCDRLYWAYGPCCAGCDHWSSEGGRTGLCDANGIVSGYDVLRSMNIIGASWIPKPGFPMTKEKFHCGKFKDDFDWNTLHDDYLTAIGAMKNGHLRNKPL